MPSGHKLTQEEFEQMLEVWNNASSAAEAAQILGKKINTVRSLVYRHRKKGFKFKMMPHPGAVCFRGVKPYTHKPRPKGWNGPPGSSHVFTDEERARGKPKSCETNRQRSEVLKALKRDKKIRTLKNAKVKQIQPANRSIQNTERELDSQAG